MARFNHLNELHIESPLLVVNAAKFNAVITSLYPESMRDRVVDQQIGTKGKMKKLLSTDSGAVAVGQDKPLADLFLGVTVLFADITGKCTFCASTFTFGLDL